MDLQQLRKSYLTLPLPTALAVLAGASKFVPGHPMRIDHVQLVLSDTGTGAGATTVDVKINGNAVTPAGGLSIAVGAASTNAGATITGAINNYPGGARLNPNDVLTVDVLAVPGTTVPKCACVILSLTQLDT